MPIAAGDRPTEGSSTRRIFGLCKHRHRDFQQLLLAAGHVAGEGRAAGLQDREEIVDIVPVLSTAASRSV